MFIQVFTVSGGSKGRLPSNHKRQEGAKRVASNHLVYSILPSEVHLRHNPSSRAKTASCNTVVRRTEARYRTCNQDNPDTTSILNVFFQYFSQCARQQHLNTGTSESWRWSLSVSASQAAAAEQILTHDTKYTQITVHKLMLAVRACLRIVCMAV